MPDVPDDMSRPQPLDYSSPKTGRMVAVARFPDEIEAHMAAARLEGEEIGAQVITRLGMLSVYGMTTPGAVLAVDRDDAQRAIALLEQTPAKQWIIRPDAQAEG